MSTDELVKRRFDRWLNDANPSEQVAARVLATTLVTPLPALQAILADTFKDQTVLERASDDLLGRPFVERMADGFRIAEPMAAHLRNWFHNTDPDGYTAVNQRMVEVAVAEVEAADDEEERWFARGRVAFYLAAIDPAESAESFIDAFSDPPPGDPGPNRSWLIQLVFKQQDRLVDESRSLRFFEGFQDYKDGRFPSAIKNLEAVLAGLEEDRYRAIALHLWSLMRDSSVLSESFLRESIELSSRLGLTENEIMARNTLVFRLIARAVPPNQRSAADLAEAVTLADENLKLAEDANDLYLQVWCRSAMAQARWLRSTEVRRHPERVSDSDANGLITWLAQATEEAFAIGDFESVVVAVNASASIMRDRGEGARALALLQENFEKLHKIEPPMAARRWIKTAGSIAQQPIDPETQRRLHLFLRHLRAWNSPGVIISL